MKAASIFLIVLILFFNGKIGDGAKCDTTQEDQCKLIVTYAQQNSFNDTELCWSLKSAVDCLTALAPSCQNDFDWKSTITDYNSQVKRLNCSNDPPPVCDSVEMTKCLNRAIDADGELKADQQCLDFQTASDCSSKLGDTCRFTPVWINVDSFVSGKLSQCADEYCNGTQIDDCMKDAKDTKGKSMPEICRDVANAITCLQPLEPGCRNNSDWNNLFGQLNSERDQCGLAAGCFLDEARQCLTKDLGISLDGSTVPGSICQNYLSFKSCWDKHVTLCSKNPVFQSLKAVANKYHECQIKCDNNVVMEVGRCYMSLVPWTDRIDGFSDVDQLHDICQNLTQFKNCYLPKRGACFYNDFIKPIVPVMDYVVNITNRLCQQEILEVDLNCFNNSDIINQTALCNAEIFKPMPDCGDIKNPNFNCTEKAVSNLCDSNNASVAVKINEDLFKLFTFNHDNAPCTTTPVPTSSHITSASGSRNPHITSGSMSSRIPVSTSAYRTTSETSGGSSLKMTVPSSGFLVLTFLLCFHNSKH